VNCSCWPLSWFKFGHWPASSCHGQYQRTSGAAWATYVGDRRGYKERRTSDKVWVDRHWQRDDDNLYSSGAVSGTINISNHSAVILTASVKQSSECQWPLTMIDMVASPTVDVSTLHRLKTAHVKVIMRHGETCILAIKLISYYRLHTYKGCTQSWDSEIKKQLTSSLYGCNVIML